LGKYRKTNVLQGMIAGSIKDVGMTKAAKKNTRKIIVNKMPTRMINNQ
jgi:hypothetical protein